MSISDEVSKIINGEDYSHKAILRFLLYDAIAYMTAERQEEYLERARTSLKLFEREKSLPVRVLKAEKIFKQELQVIERALSE